jgi:hypothetical protein
MPTGLGPPHDRLQLSPAERRVIASLEFRLAEEDRAATRPKAPPRRTAGALGERLLRLAPLLLPLATIITLATFSVSVVGGVACALVTGVLLAVTIGRIVRRRDRGPERSRRSRP